MNSLIHFHVSSLQPTARISSLLEDFVNPRSSNTLKKLNQEVSKESMTILREALPNMTVWNDYASS
jgi:acyl carrier protein phosphodiesterase